MICPRELGLCTPHPATPLLPAKTCWQTVEVDVCLFLSLALSEHSGNAGSWISVFWLDFHLGVPFLQCKDPAGVLLRINWLLLTQHFKVWSIFLIQTTSVESCEYSVAILSLVLNIVMRRHRRHAGNYSRNRPCGCSQVCRYPALQQQHPTASSAVPNWSSSTSC